MLVNFEMFTLAADGIETLMLAFTCTSKAGQFVAQTIHIYYLILGFAVNKNEGASTAKSVFPIVLKSVRKRSVTQGLTHQSMA